MSLHAGSLGRHSILYVSVLPHQNTILLVDTLNWEVIYKDLVNKVKPDTSTHADDALLH